MKTLRKPALSPKIWRARPDSQFLDGLPIRNLGSTMKRKKSIEFLSEPETKRRQRVDTDPSTTDKKGFWGLYELALRRFKTVVYTGTIAPLYVLGSCAIGAALVPGIELFRFLSDLTAGSHWALHDLAI